MTLQPQPIREPAEISLDRHGFIEASAGTGKTYLIEQLTLRILEEYRIPLNAILLVTFTEKATGELKSRIRRSIEKRRNESSDPEIQSIMAKALEQFDEASIFTIHGFCQKSLRQFAFEARQDFELEMTDDTLLYSALLENQMRDVWPSEFAPHLLPLLTYSRFSKDFRNSVETLILNLAKSCQPWRGDQLIPDIPPNTNLDDFLNEIRQTLNQLLNKVGTIQPSNPKNSEFINQYNSLNFHGTTKGANIRNILNPVFEFLAFYLEQPLDFMKFHEFFSVFSKTDFSRLIPPRDKWTPKGTDYQQGLPALPTVVEHLKTLQDLFFQLCVFLPVRSHALLLEAAETHKERKSLITYDDMLRKLRDALRRCRSLLRKMQEQYRFALVDEFQDTDPVQWEIFKTLFTDTSSDHRLFLIGDPKQAIYKFRGADIEAYRDARRWMQSEKQNCLFYTLSTNWRSTPKLIDGLNALFCENQWFSKESDMQAEKVSPSPPQKRHHTDVDDSFPVQALTLDPNLTATQARWRMANWIAEEIHRLLGLDRQPPQSRLYKCIDKNQLPIEPDDIFILIRKKAEASAIENELQRWSIPYEYYKKQGLFQSREARHVGYLLAALNQPQDRAAIRALMLSDFFRISPTWLLDEQEDTLPDHEFHEPFQHWLRLAEAGQWARLFYNIQTGSRLYLKRGNFSLPEPVSSRTRVNYRSILQILEYRAVAEQWNLETLYENMFRYQSMSSITEEELSLHFPASSDKRVKLMTIHMSKGLEAPVVFLAGGFSESMQIGIPLQYHQNSHRIFSLIKTPEAKEAAKNETLEEDQRIYYVALTRAGSRLYLPYYRKESKNQTLFGPAVQTFLYNALESVLPLSQNESPFMFHPCPDSIKNPPDGADAKNPVASHSQDRENDFSVTRITSQFCIPPGNLDFRRIGLDSYSGLWGSYQKTVKSREEVDIDFHSILLSDEKHTHLPLDVEPDGQTQLLPPGAETGSMLHEIIEHCHLESLMDRSSFSDLESHHPMEAELIRSTLARFGFERDQSTLLDLVFSMIRQAACTPVSSDQDSIPIGKIPACDQRTEMEFFIPFPSQDVRQFKEALPETFFFSSCKEHYLRGFMDLAFRLPGENSGHHRYFVLDWKSNYLETGYGGPQLFRSMTEHGYLLQAGIYGMALCHWLRNLLPNFSYEHHFGGVYYLFLRGLSAEDPKRGVFFFRPEQEADLHPGPIMRKIMTEKGIFE